MNRDLPDCPWRADCDYCQTQGFDWPLCTHDQSHFLMPPGGTPSKHASYHECEQELEAGKCPEGWV